MSFKPKQCFGAG